MTTGSPHSVSNAESVSAAWLGLMDLCHRWIPLNGVSDAHLLSCYLFTKRTGVLPQDLVKSRKPRDLPGVDIVKFKSDMIIVTSNLAASRLDEIRRPSA